MSSRTSSQGRGDSVRSPIRVAAPLPPQQGSPPLATGSPRGSFNGIPAAPRSRPSFPRADDASSSPFDARPTRQAAASSESNAPPASTSSPQGYHRVTTINIDAPIQTPSRTDSANKRNTPVVRHTTTSMASPPGGAQAAWTEHLSSLGGGAAGVNGSSPLARATSESETLRKMLSDRESELVIRGEQYRLEQREWSDVLRLNQEELSLARRTIDSLKRELHEAQEREQASVEQQDKVQATYHKAAQQFEATAAELSRLQELVKKRSEEVRRLEDVCTARAKELSIVTIGRSRSEKRAAALQTELDDVQKQLVKLKESTSTKSSTLSNQVDRLQKELSEANSAYEGILEERQEEVRLLTEEVQCLRGQLAIETKQRGAAEDNARLLQERVTEEQALLRQCDATMTALDEENKHLQESNDALRENAERLGEAVKEKTEHIEVLAVQVHDLKDQNVVLTNSLTSAEAARAVLSANLKDTMTRLDATLDELDTTTSEMDGKHRLHMSGMAELQHAHVTLRRQSEEDISELQNRVKQLEEQLEDARNALVTTRNEAEKRLFTTVASRETELMREASTKRQELYAELTRDFETDPRVIRYAELRDNHHALLLRMEKQRAFVEKALEHDVPANEAVARRALEEYAEYVLGMLQFTGQEIPALFDTRLKQQSATIASLEGDAERATLALEAATSELEAARSDVSRYQRNPDLAFILTTRADFVKSVAELFLRSRLTRRRLRSLFALPSWRLLLKEQLIPDDFGQLLCDIVDDFQWLYDKHRDMATHSLTSAEREQWCIATHQQSAQHVDVHDDEMQASAGSGWMLNDNQHASPPIQFR